MLSNHDTQIKLFCCLVVLSTALMSCTGVEAKAPKCLTGYFSPNGDNSDSEIVECNRCSACPLNQIIRTPCTEYTDTLCGPFYEFENFQQGPDESDLDPLQEGVDTFPKDQSEELEHLGVKDHFSTTSNLMTDLKNKELSAPNQTKGMYVIC